MKDGLPPPAIAPFTSGMTKYHNGPTDATDHNGTTTDHNGGPLWSVAAYSVAVFRHTPYGQQLLIFLSSITIYNCIDVILALQYTFLLKLS